MGTNRLTKEQKNAIREKVRREYEIPVVATLVSTESESEDDDALFTFAPVNIRHPAAKKLTKAEKQAIREKVRLVAEEELAKKQARLQEMRVLYAGKRSAPEPKDNNFKFDQPFNNENEAHTLTKVRNQIGMLIIGVALGVCFQFHFGGVHDAVGTNLGLAIDAARDVVAKIGENLVKLLLWLADAIRARI